MTTPMNAVSAIAGIQANLGALRGAAPGAGTSGVFDAILAALTSGSTGGTEDAWGAKLVDDARGFIGTPYVLGGRTTSGIDCSGLVKTVLEKYGIDAPHHSGLQGELGTEVPSLAEAKPGDLLVLNNGHHIGIYAGDNKVIHAPSPGKKVLEQELWTGDAGIVTIRRIDPPASEAAPPVDVSQIISGLAMLGNLSSLLNSSPALPGSLLGGSALGGSALGGSALASLIPLGSTTPLGSAELTQLQAQRWALLAKGNS